MRLTWCLMWAIYAFGRSHRVRESFAKRGGCGESSVMQLARVCVITFLILSYVRLSLVSQSSPYVILYNISFSLALSLFFLYIKTPETVREAIAVSPSALPDSTVK